MYFCIVLLFLSDAISCSSVAVTYQYTYSIATEWNGNPVVGKHVHIELKSYVSGVKITVNSPLYNDPGNPGGTAGLPFPKLWNYEVAEAFFLNDRDQYLEVELSPHGQHLLLLLNGKRNATLQQLQIKYIASIKNQTWTGLAWIPEWYFPPKVSKFNAYAIHGSGANRTYLALYPTPSGKFTQPDFHRLEYFQPIDFQTLYPRNWNSYVSPLWTKSVPVIG